jgi:hypothetical protein
MLNKHKTKDFEKNDVNFKQAFISGTNLNFCTSKKISRL